MLGSICSVLEQNSALKSNFDISKTLYTVKRYSGWWWRRISDLYYVEWWGYFIT